MKKMTSRQSCELLCSRFLQFLTGDVQSPGSAGNQEPGNHAELFHHLKPICCDKKTCFADQCWAFRSEVEIRLFRKVVNHFLSFCLVILQD